MLHLILILIIGLVAQLTDGTLGMGYGVTASTALLSLGLYPAVVSASVHIAEIFTSFVSGGVHYKLGNVRRDIATPLTVAGVIGGILGAYTAVIIPQTPLKIGVSLVLLVMGIVIVYRFIDHHRRNTRYLPDGGQAVKYRTIRTLSSKRLLTLGGFAGFLDAIGGGGWGPIATSNLVLIDDIKPREAVGSVNFAEFFQTIAVSATFVFLLTDIDWLIIGSLILGGVTIAPFAALLVKRVPHRLLGIAIGGLVIALSLSVLIQFLLPG